MRLIGRTAKDQPKFQPGELSQQLRILRMRGLVHSSREHGHSVYRIREPQLLKMLDCIDGWLARRLGQETAFGLYLDPVADKLMVAAALVMLVDRYDSLWLILSAIIIIGLAIAPVLPALISGTADRVGQRFAANTIGIQIAAMGVGGATVPSICGVMAKRYSDL